MKYNLITILGPTAVGKTNIGAGLANEFNGEVISADSRQAYRRMNIGTGKDLHEYDFDGVKIPYHLIDIIEPNEEFNLFVFREKFYEAFCDITKRNKIPFMVGGTAMYVNSIIQNYMLAKVSAPEERIAELNENDEEELRNILLSLNRNLHNKTDLTDKERIIKAILVAESENTDDEKVTIHSLNIGIHAEPEVVRKRITARLKLRLENGMIEEVQSLLNEGITYEKLDFFGLEYKFLGKYLKGELNYNDMFQKLNSAIHHFAKRQMTWFRKMSREGVEINWINGADYAKAKEIVLTKYFDS